MRTFAWITAVCLLFAAPAVVADDLAGDPADPFRVSVIPNRDDAMIAFINVPEDRLDAAETVCTFRVVSGAESAEHTVTLAAAFDAVDFQTFCLFRLSDALPGITWPPEGAFRVDGSVSFEGERLAARGTTLQVNAADLSSRGLLLTALGELGTVEIGEASQDIGAIYYFEGTISGASAEPLSFFVEEGLVSSDPEVRCGRGPDPGGSMCFVAVRNHRLTVTGLDAEAVYAAADAGREALTR